MILVLPYPHIDPVALELGPLLIRWYSLAYIAGLVLGWRYCLALVKRPPAAIAPEKIDDFLLWATLAVIVGGRLGYALFYKPGFYLSNPEEIFLVWKGGMSFHGGFLGLIAAIALFCRRHAIPFLGLGDLVCAAAPLGLQPNRAEADPSIALEETPCGFLCAMAPVVESPPAEAGDEALYGRCTARSV